MNLKESSSRPSILALLGSSTDVRQKSSKYSAMEATACTRVIASSLIATLAHLTNFDTEVFAKDLTELRNRINPFAQSLMRKKMSFTPLASRRRTKVCCFASEYAPHSQEGKKVACWMLKSKVRKIRRVAVLMHTNPRILHSQPCRDHQDIIRAMLIDRSQQHAREPRIEREMAHGLTNLGEPSFCG
jgi:hypothetical protein